MGMGKKEETTDLRPLTEALKGLKTGSENKIDVLLSLLTVFSGREPEVLRQWCMAELLRHDFKTINEDFKLPDLVETLYLNMGRLSKKPAIYYFITLLKKNLSRREQIITIIKKHGGWPENEALLLTKLGEILGDMTSNNERQLANSIILEISGSSVTHDNRDALINRFLHPRITVNETPMQLAKQLDELPRAPDSPKDQRICGIILALSQSREHIIDDLSRLLAIELEANNYEINDIINTFDNNLRELSPKPAILYALYILKNSELDDNKNRIKHVIHLLANWPYDLQKFTAQLGKHFKEVLDNNESKLINKMIGDLSGENLKDNTAAATWIHKHFPTRVIKAPTKFPVPAIRSHASRINDHITRQLRNLLEGLGCEFVKFNWALDLNDPKAIADFREVINSVSHLRLTSEIIELLGKRNLTIRSEKLLDNAAEKIVRILNERGFSAEVDDDCVVINVIGKINEVEKIINAHQVEQRKMPSALQNQPVEEAGFDTTQFVAETANFVNNTDTFRQIMTSIASKFPDMQDVFINADEASDKSTGILQQVFAGMFLVAKIQENKLAAEELSLYSINAVESGFDLFRQFAPELFKASFKKTPFGPIFVAARQLVSELFFARDWQQGRNKHHEIRFNIGERCQHFAKLYHVIYQFIISQIREKIKMLRNMPNMEKCDVNSLLATVSEQPPEIQQILYEINRLSASITTAKESFENLIKETRREASRLNTEQQVLMTTKHIDRAFNAMMIGLGVGAAFVPILGVPAAALALTKNIADKKIKAKIKSAVEIVQGIYETDNTIIISKKGLKQAIKKLEGINEVVLQYSPPVIDAFKLTRSLRKTAIEIRNNPEYILNIPDAMKYKKLDSYAKPNEIQQQIGAFTLTCQQLQYHLQILLGQTGMQIDGADAFDAKVHQTPHIHNIGALMSLIREWSENLKIRMRDQRFNPDSKFYHSNFTHTKQTQIEEMVSLLDELHGNYQLHRSEEVPDPVFLGKLNDSIEDEIATLEKILENAVNKNILNGNAILLRLKNRFDNLVTLSKMDYLNTIEHKDRQNHLKRRIDEIEKIISNNYLPQLKQIPPKHLQHAQSDQKTIPISELNLYLGPGVKISKKPSITISIHHYRYFENRRAANETLSRQLSSKVTTDVTELYLTPVGEFNSGYLNNAGFWKNIWLIRGINRAVEFVENIAKRASIHGPHIIPMNISHVLNQYKDQLTLIQNHSHLHLSKFGSKIIKSQAIKSIESISRLLESMPIPLPHQMMES